MGNNRCVNSLPLILFLLLLNTCGPDKNTDNTGKPAPASINDNIYYEAPQLAALVKAGALLSVDQRLPINPLVIQPVEKTGIYGGTWRMGITEASDLKFIRVNAGYENLVRWDPSWIRILPNLAQSWEVSKDAREFTFHLREGLRWSDGVTFTADDILFWYEADLLNKELNNSVPGYLVADGVPVIIEKIDLYTVKFSFAGPYGQFLSKLADIGADEITALPMHYMKQFHPDYNPGGIEELVREAGVDSWTRLWKNKCQYYDNPDMPVMNAWVLTEWHTENSPFIVMERNPWYWKIDTDLNQLPYIDRIQFKVYPSSSEIQLAAMAGEIDAQYINLGIRESSITDWAVQMTSGDYQLHPLVNPRANYLSVQLNLVHQDPDLRAVFFDKDFRIALSISINRTEIIDRAIGIPLEICQPAPLLQSPYYREQLANQYTDFDPAKANQLLDEAGYAKRDNQGYRITPSGRRIEFTLSMAKDQIYVDTAEMLAQYWKKLDILVHIEKLDNSSLTRLIRENGHDAVISSVNGGLDVVDNPGVYLPFSGSDFLYGTPWLYWSQNHSLGEEPPAAVKSQLQLYEQIKASADPDQISSLMGQILAIAEEQFYVMGICKPEDFYILVKSNFHNVPGTMPKSFSYPTPAPTNPCQYFIDPMEQEK